MPHAAATVDAREAGYREALFMRGAPSDGWLSRRLAPDDAAAVGAMMDETRADAIVCANDRTAAHLMRTLLRLGFAVPDDVRMVGIDDLEVAALLPVPLTTLRQPAAHIGEAAIATMMERVARRDLPTRDVLVRCELVVRQSCGAGTLARPRSSTEEAPRLLAD